MKDHIVTSIRIPTAIFNNLRKVARRERRSISQQIILYVENRLHIDGQFPETGDFLNQESGEIQESEDTPSE